MLLIEEFNAVSCVWPELVKSTYPFAIALLFIAAWEILFEGKETEPAVTLNPLLHVKDPLSIVEGRLTVPVKVGLFNFAKLFKDVCRSVPFKFIAGVLSPVVKLGLFMFAFNAI